MYEALADKAFYFSVYLIDLNSLENISPKSPGRKVMSSLQFQNDDRRELTGRVTLNTC